MAAATLGDSLPTIPRTAGGPYPAVLEMVGALLGIVPAIQSARVLVPAPLGPGHIK